MGGAMDDFGSTKMTRRNQLLHPAPIAMLCAVLAAGTAWGQRAPAADPSPFAPGDLKRPIFDTSTPVYGKADEQAKSAQTVVAEVDGRAITLGDVKDAIADLPPTARNLPFSELYPSIRGQLVRQQALVIRAQRHAVDEDPAVRRKLKAASDRVLISALLEQEISRSITEAALLERYNKDIAGKPGPEEVHVRVIMVPTEQEALAAIGELRGGANFAELAKRVSKDATALAGGDAGFVTIDGLTPEVGPVVFAMAPGQFTAFPVHSVGSWFVLKVEERRQQPTPPFSVVREDLRQAMLREGVSDVVKAALSDVTVREYDIVGKETDQAAEDQAARSSLRPGHP
jgi:peptidyl-prolyl cis-trans isomerase C